jgi:hypothetical protein
MIRPRPTGNLADLGFFGQDRALEKRFQFTMTGCEGPQVPPTRGTRRARAWVDFLPSVFADGAIAATDPPSSCLPAAQNRCRHAPGWRRSAPQNQGFSDRCCGWSWIASIACIFRDCKRSSFVVALGYLDAFSDRKVSKRS